MSWPSRLLTDWSIQVVIHKWRDSHFFRLIKHWKFLLKCFFFWREWTVKCLFCTPVKTMLYNIFKHCCTKIANTTTTTIFFLSIFSLLMTVMCCISFTSLNFSSFVRRYDGDDCDDTLSNDQNKSSRFTCNTKYLLELRILLSDNVKTVQNILLLLSTVYNNDLHLLNFLIPITKVSNINYKR